MDIQDMKQAGLAGEFLAENESAAPPESQEAIQAIGLTSSSIADESAKAQKRANLVLAVLFMAGMGVVYFMSMHNEPVKANASDITSKTIVDHAVEQFQTNAGGVPATDPSSMSLVELADEMTTGTAKRQVPLKELKDDNPFLLARAKRKPLETAEPAKKTPGMTALQRVRKLQLQSIVVTKDRSLAIISDRLLTVGQEISGWQVHEIGDELVTLKYRTLTHVLRKKQ